MKIFNKALYTIFLSLLAISNFPLLANDEKVNIELALEHNLTHLPGAFNLIRAIRPHLAALKIKSEAGEIKESEAEIQSFSAQFIKDNLKYIQTIKFNNNKNNLDRWALYNLFHELYNQTAAMELPDDRYLIVKRFYDAIIDSISSNNEKTKVLLFCLRHIYFDFCGSNGVVRNEGIFSSIKTTITENEVEAPEVLLRNVEACVMCVLKQFTHMIKRSKEDVAVKNERYKHTYEYFSNVSSILKKLINNYTAASKEKVDNNQQASNGSKKSSNKKKKKKKVVSKVRAPFIKIQKEDPIISPDYEGPDVGPIDLPAGLIEEKEISAKPPLKIDVTFKFLSGNTEKENIVLLHRLFTTLKEQRTVENSKEQDKLIEEIANNNPHLFYQITLIKIIYFTKYNDSQSFEKLVFNSMKNFFNTHKPKLGGMKRTLIKVADFYQKFGTLSISKNKDENWRRQLEDGAAIVGAMHKEPSYFLWENFENGKIKLEEIKVEVKPADGPSLYQESLAAQKAQELKEEQKDEKLYRSENFDPDALPQDDPKSNPKKSRLSSNLEKLGWEEFFFGPYFGKDQLQMKYPKLNINSFESSLPDEIVPQTGSEKVVGLAAIKSLAQH